MNWLSFVYFPITAVSPTHNNDILPFKIITGSHCTITQITTQLSACPTISSQFLWVDRLLLSHQNSHQSMTAHCWYTVSHVLSKWHFTAYIYAIFYWLFFCFSLGLFVLSQLYGQYFTFSTSFCTCSQSTLNTVTQWWHCLKHIFCVIICDCWQCVCVCVCVCQLFFSTSDFSMLKSVLNTRW